MNTGQSASRAQRSSRSQFCGARTAPRFIKLRRGRIRLMRIGNHHEQLNHGRIALIAEPDSDFFFCGFSASRRIAVVNPLDIEMNMFSGAGGSVPYI